jgi:hypothetical protein
VRRAYRLGVAGFALAFLGIGVALIVVTAIHGGGIGYLLGALFVAAGTARLVLLRRGTRL